MSGTYTVRAWLYPNQICCMVYDKHYAWAISSSCSCFSLFATVSLSLSFVIWKERSCHTSGYAFYTTNDQHNPPLEILVTTHQGFFLFSAQFLGKPLSLSLTLSRHHLSFSVFLKHHEQANETVPVLDDFFSQAAFSSPPPLTKALQTIEAKVCQGLFAAGMQVLK